jgi:CheY-like chemotaxis protein
VLIIEYDRWLRLTARLLLEELGFEVATASNGQAGLRLALALMPGVIVVGANLPEISAPELLRELRLVFPCPSVRLVDLQALLVAAQQSDQELRRGEQPMRSPFSAGATPPSTTESSRCTRTRPLATPAVRIPNTNSAAPRGPAAPSWASTGSAPTDGRVLQRAAPMGLSKT